MRENTLASEQTKPVVSRILPSSPSWVRIKCDSRDPAQDRIREGGNVLISFVFFFYSPGSAHANRPTTSGYSSDSWSRGHYAVQGVW